MPNNGGRGNCNIVAESLRGEIHSSPAGDTYFTSHALPKGGRLFCPLYVGEALVTSPIQSEKVGRHPHGGFGRDQSYLLHLSILSSLCRVITEAELWS